MNAAVTTLILLISQTEIGPLADPTVPVWGWLTVIGALASAVATLAGLYKGARDREVAAEQSKTALLQEVGKSNSQLLERAIEVFTLSRAGNDALTDKVESVLTELRAVKEEVRRVSEKGR